MTFHRIALLAIFSVATYAHSAGTPALNDIQVAQNTPAASYSGGGIRGALAAVPDGWLVSPMEAQEFKGEDGFNEQPALRARAVVPLIDIVKPEPVADLKVKAPFAISVLFKGQSDAAIDPTTFKVMYGALKIDITSRITKFVTVTKEGFSLEDAKIPAGKHRLTLQVMDEKQRVAERELRVEVE
jgi:hypothetical protein